MGLEALTSEVCDLVDYKYGATHLISTGVVLALVVLVIIIGRSKRLTERTKHELLINIAAFQLIFEIVWRIIWLNTGTELVWLWPTYPCNLGGVLIPLIAIIDWKPGKQMFYLFGFLGAVITFVAPDGIYNTEHLTIPILKSILQHTGLLLIPALEHTMGRFKVNILSFPMAIVGCLIHLGNCEVINLLLGFDTAYYDFMFLRGTLPFVIPGVPQWLTLSIVMTLVLFLLSIVIDVKTARDYFKKLFRKSQLQTPKQA